MLNLLPTILYHQHLSVYSYCTAAFLLIMLVSHEACRIDEGNEAPMRSNHHARSARPSLAHSESGWPQYLISRDRFIYVGCRKFSIITHLFRPPLLFVYPMVRTLLPWTLFALASPRLVRLFCTLLHHSLPILSNALMTSFTLVNIGTRGQSRRHRTDWYNLR
jgi:hypothetical protein